MLRRLRAMWAAMVAPATPAPAGVHHLAPLQLPPPVQPISPDEAEALAFYRDALHLLEERARRARRGELTRWPAPKPMAVAPAAQVEGDALANEALGYGPGQDTIHQAEPVPPPHLSEDQARDLHRGGLFKRIVNVIPEDAMSNGWQVHSGDDRDVAKQIDKQHGIRAKAGQAWQLARRDTFALWWVQAPGESGQPLGPGPHDVVGVRVVEACEAEPEIIDDDPQSPTFGDVTVWRITLQRDGLSLPSFLLHHTRAIVWRVQPTGPVERRHGSRALGGTSVLESYFWAVVELDYLLSAARRVVGESSVPVLKRSSRAPAAGKQATSQRGLIAAWNQIRSVFKVTVIGPDDDFTRIHANTQGVSDLIAQQWGKVAAHEGIPITRLTMQPPPGLSTADKSGDQAYRQLCKRRRGAVADPALEAWYLITLGEDDERTIAWGPVDVPDAETAARISKTLAERDAILVHDLGMPVRASLARLVGDSEQASPVLSDSDIEAADVIDPTALRNSIANTPPPPGSDDDDAQTDGGDAADDGDPPVTDGGA